MTTVQRERTDCNEFAKQWMPLAYKIARRHYRSERIKRDQIDDMANELIVRLWLTRHKYDPEVSSETTFRYRVASSYAWNVLRSMSAGVSCELLEKPVAVRDTVADAVDAKDYVETVLQAIPERERETLRRRHGIGGSAQTLQEIGDTLGVSKQMASLNAINGMDRLRKIANRNTA